MGGTTLYDLCYTQSTRIQDGLLTAKTEVNDSYDDDKNSSKYYTVDLAEGREEGSDSAFQLGLIIAFMMLYIPVHNETEHL